MKDRFGDFRSSNNYRPVMSSSVFFKLFEYCLHKKISPYIQLSDRQHGFRASHSTSTACFILKETIFNYFSSQSNVHACFVDIRKAFDSVDHGILMEKLDEYSIPKCYNSILRYAYDHQLVNVRYKSCFSAEWKIDKGVRQGGVLSGLLFSVYINSLIDNISKLKIGCKLGIQAANIIAYADDIVLLAPTTKGLQSLLDETILEATAIRLEFNDEKSKYMLFKRSGKVDIHFSVNISGKSIEHVNGFKYLGFFLMENLSNKEDVCRVRNKFYGDFNNLLRKFCFASPSVKLFLFQNFCTVLWCRVMVL